MEHGLLPLPWWGYIVVALVLTHVTIACVTIYLHRHSAHRALESRQTTGATVLVP